MPACATESSSSNSAASATPFTMSGLPFGVHQVEWNSGPLNTSDRLVLWGIDAVRLAEGSAMSNVTVDDTFTHSDPVSITYDSPDGNEAWTHLADGTSSDQRSYSEVNVRDGYFNKTLAITQSKDASVTFSGSGSAIYLYGTVGPDFGQASISMNGQTIVSPLNLTYPWAIASQLLWFQTGLDTTKINNVTMTNLGTEKMALDFVILTTDNDSISKLTHASSTNSFTKTLAGKLVLCLVVPIVATSLAALLLLCLFRRRNRQSRASRPRPRSRGPSLSLQSSPGGLFPHERKRRGSVTSMNSGFTATEVFVSYDEGVSQRLSDRWHSPTGPDHGMQERGETPRTAIAPSLASVSESLHFSPFTTPIRKNHPLRFVVGSNYPESIVGPPLPAYTLERTHTLVTTASGGALHSPDGTTSLTTIDSSPSRHLTAEEEKAVQLRMFRDLVAAEGKDPDNSQPSSSRLPHYDHNHNDEDNDDVPHSAARLSTVAPSSIMSIFAASPRSERRFSAMTDFTTTNATPFHPDTYPPPPLPTPPARLRVDMGFLKDPNQPFRRAKDLYSATSTPSTTTPKSSDRLLRPGLASAVSPRGNAEWSDSTTTRTNRAHAEDDHDGSFSIARHGGGPPLDRDRAARRRDHSVYSAYTAFTETSAARPDSEVIPSEDFLTTLNEAAREERERGM
nr:uncharacterized protein CI109_003155 [Kwoniella shandongensis]KAA5528623.1 hypothetical protein CI109_003155 [Kwoniella shandongensis]